MSNVIPLRPHVSGLPFELKLGERPAGEVSPGPESTWTSTTGKTTVVVTVTLHGLDAGSVDREELVGHLRQLADVYEGPLGSVFFGEAG